jgi:hypothetical protein
MAAYNIPPCVFISSHGDFSLGKIFYTWSLISSHFSIKYLNIIIYPFRQTFWSQKLHFSHHKNLFLSFLVNFHQFQALSSRLQQILGKYGLFVYLAIYQRSSHLQYSQNIFQKMFNNNYKSIKVYS